jgi:hypothetical protein
VRSISDSTTIPTTASSHKQSAKRRLRIPSVPLFHNPRIGVFISMRKVVVSLVASTLFAGFALSHAEDASSPVPAGAQPDGTLTFRGGSVAAGIGYVWGSGDLSYGGKAHQFKISGLSIVDVGAANITAAGHVYNLKTLADFGGNYVELSAGLTVAGGGSVAYLKNEHGVVIKLEATAVGLRFNLSGDGVKVTLKS